MTSSQPSRSSAYSEDLRWKIIWQRFSLELPVKSVARNLSIDESTVRRICTRFNCTGTVSKQLYPVERSYRKLTTTAKFYVVNLVLERPGIYLEKLRTNCSRSWV